MHAQKIHMQNPWLSFGSSFENVTLIPSFKNTAAIKMPLELIQISVISLE